MKKLYILAIVLWSTITIATAQIKNQVKESFELTSIAFRLAGAQEYVNDDLLGYTTDIDNYFAKYKDHKLISYIKEIRENQGIGYDAVSLAAGCIDIRGGKVMIASQCDATKIGKVDKRWTEQSFKTFVHLLNDFYKQSKFGDFYVQHTNLYRLAESRLNDVLVNLDTDWFKSLFGKDLVNPLVVASLCNGSSNYAFSGTEGESRFGITIGSSADSKGQPAYNRQVIFIIVHEFLHHYVNSLIYKSWAQMDSASEIIYSQVKDKMAKMAYGNAQTTMTEWFINLLSIMYIQDYPDLSRSPFEHVIALSQNSGFVWMDRSVKFMDHFRNHRDLYNTIGDFMPQIAGFVNFTAANYNQILKEYENRGAYITDIFPVSGSIFVSGMDTIRIHFSRPMWGSHGTKPIEGEDILYPPCICQPYFEDESTYCMILDKNKLEKGRTYGFKLNRQSFQSEKGIPMKEDYPYIFKTPDK